MPVITDNLPALSDFERKRGDRERRDQQDCWTREGQSVTGRAAALFWELSRRLSQPGPTASHVLLAEAHMNYYISFCYLSLWFITGKQLSFKRSTTLRGPPLRCPQKERERESLHSPLKRTEEDGQNHIVRGFKKEAYGCYEKKRNVLLKAEKNESAR